jgi:hypothetical protein
VQVISKVAADVADFDWVFIALGSWNGVRDRVTVIEQDVTIVPDLLANDLNVVIVGTAAGPNSARVIAFGDPFTKSA